jgi:hypothetical protein
MWSNKQTIEKLQQADAYFPEGGTASFEKH